MTAEIVEVPPRPRRPLPPTAEPAGTPDSGRHWRRLALRGVLVPLIVLFPLLTLTPSADHRFNIYANGGLYASRPWHLLRVAVESVPMFLDRGNFRPLGRVVEWSLDVVAFALTGLVGLPANIGLRLVSFGAAVLLTLAAVLFAAAVTTRGRLFGAAPSVPVALVPFAVGAGLVAAGRTSTTVLFGGLYLTTSALVLAVGAWACRSRRPGLLVVLAGAALAAFNELAYLAVPLATAAVLLRGRVVLGNDWRTTLRGSGVRFAGLLWLGFLPVFVPVRLLIMQRCAGGGCYTGSDLALGGAPAALPNRLLSWLPPLMWRRAGGDPLPHLAALLPVLAFMLLAVLAWRALRQLPQLPALDRGQALGLAGAAAVLLLLAGTLAALNADVQAIAGQGRWGQGWRDSGLTTAAGSLLVLACWRRFVPVLLVLLMAGGVLAAAANKDYRDTSGRGQYPYLHDRIAQEIAGFDRTPAGDARRCALRAAVITIAATEREVERFDVSVTRATRHLAGRPFCTRAGR
ncbi:hypothetical protein [Paractinoplanes rishiriensis]|uniref:Uncharacterized protein n=1 Tax=Paractinoplanes rishiriensis TaxID=1050105 RepID=A0A919MZD3_9ACTN|nr:hypothetical protein [Actinoplanes rishiriensis]GIE93652.1 hypothetical protein Ari01nite_11170 [Actinoplanes rishiriensis]